MDILVVILFAITLLYLGVTERYRTYANLIGLQGIILFVLSFLNLEKITPGNLLFVASETLVFKVIVVPYFLYRIINRKPNRNFVQPMIRCMPHSMRCSPANWSL